MAVGSGGGGGRRAGAFERQRHSGFFVGGFFAGSTPCSRAAAWITRGGGAGSASYPFGFRRARPTGCTIVGGWPSASG